MEMEETEATEFVISPRLQDEHHRMQKEAAASPIRNAATSLKTNTGFKG